MKYYISITCRKNTASNIRSFLKDERQITPSKENIIVFLVEGGKEIEKNTSIRHKSFSIILFH
jgi:hypothetical protein